MRIGLGIVQYHLRRKQIQWLRTYTIGLSEGKLYWNWPSSRPERAKSLAAHSLGIKLRSAGYYLPIGPTCLREAAYLSWRPRVFCMPEVNVYVSHKKRKPTELDTWPDELVKVTWMSWCTIKASASRVDLRFLWEIYMFTKEGLRVR